LISFHILDIHDVSHVHLLDAAIRDVNVTNLTTTRDLWLLVQIGRRRTKEVTLNLHTANQKISSSIAVLIAYLEKDVGGFAAGSDANDCASLLGRGKSKIAQLKQRVGIRGTGIHQ
jgi:hypothetical protein